MISKFLDVDEYRSSFEINLNNEAYKKQKCFWKAQFPKLILKFKAQIEKEDKSTDSTKADRINYFQKEYEDNVNSMMNSSEFISVRKLLELNEILLRKYKFQDVWYDQKQRENFEALLMLNERLNEIDSFSNNPYKKWQEIIRGVLAGNIFDAGATAVEEIRKNNKNFGLFDALKKIQERPWLVDNFDSFFYRLEQKPFKCCAFFCDNSGVDFILGVIPFIRELLNMNTKVILCANSNPSLNDITYKELINVIKEVGNICNSIKENWERHSLMLCENSQNGCCLNFLDIDESLFDLMVKMDVDLIIIEGMGRAIHTNYHTKFKTNTLKLAAIKNSFLAESLGGKIFDAICKYECNT